MIKTYIALINACSHCGDIIGAENKWNHIIDNDIKYDEYLVTAVMDCFARREN